MTLTQHHSAASAEQMVLCSPVAMLGALLLMTLLKSVVIVDAVGHEAGYSEGREARERCARTPDA